MTDFQSNDMLTGRIAANRQMIKHCENEIWQLEGVLKHRGVKLDPQPLKLQVGKTYARADGEERTICDCEEGCGWPFRDNLGYWYSSSGEAAVGVMKNLIREVVRETSAEVIKALSELIVGARPYDAGEIATLLTRAIELMIKEEKCSW